MKITTKWQTVHTRGFRCSVNPRNENRAAHGGVCLTQVRLGARGVLMRRVNSTGRHIEVGPSELISDSEAAKLMELAE